MPSELIAEITRLLTPLPGQGAHIHGWTELPKALRLAELIVESRPRLCAEIGAFGGRSFLAAAMALRHNGVRAQIIGIDPYLHAPCFEGKNDPANDAYWKRIDLDAISRSCMEAIYRHQLQAWAVLVRAEARHCVDLFADNTVGYAMIDGCHSELASTRDVTMYLPKVVSGGYIVLDDHRWHSTQRAVALLDAACERIGEAGDPEGNCCMIFRKR